TTTTDSIHPGPPETTADPCSPVTARSISATRRLPARPIVPKDDCDCKWFGFAHGSLQRYRISDGLPADSQSLRPVAMSLEIGHPKSGILLRHFDAPDISGCLAQTDQDLVVRHEQVHVFQRQPGGRQPQSVEMPYRKWLARGLIRHFRCAQ